MSQGDDTTIRFSGLKPGRYEYAFVLDDAFFAERKNDEIRGGSVEIKAKMERKEHLLMFNFELQGEVETWCDRCLGEMKVPIEGEEALCVRFSDTEVCDDEDVVVLPEDAYEIDLEQWLYEYVAVRIPLQHMHPEGECDPNMVCYLTSEEELAARQTEGTDPRWSALKEMLNDEGETKNEINK